MKQLLTILVKCFCTPIFLIIRICYFIIALMMWDGKYMDKSECVTDEMIDMWKN